MSQLYISPHTFALQPLQATAKYILRTQSASGAIPWFEKHYLDPWDHVEAAMGLDVCGETQAAHRAYSWLCEQQLPNGGWWARYDNEEKPDSQHRHIESNFCAYIAVGVWHHYQISEDRNFLDKMWEPVKKAMNLVVSLQQVQGEIPWACDKNATAVDDALLTGCSSIAKSLECALAIAKELGMPDQGWQEAHYKLLTALRYHPERFDRNWDSKARFAMDWYYPVLCGVLQGSAAQAHINARWDDFVVPDLGCRCVREEPWIAVAESCELVIALLAAGQRSRAANLYSWLHHRSRTENGAYWTGYQYELEIPWPHEQTTWTAGAVLLAADALSEHTAASRLFLGPVCAEADNMQSHKDEAAAAI